MNNTRCILNHVAIPLSFAEDIQKFYIDILGFTELYQFVVEKESALAIFDADRELNVTLIEKDGLRIELFNVDEYCKPGIAHICLEIFNIKEVCLNAERAGYKVTRIDRPSGVIAFISDKTGNRFEIKESR